jgi:hypothetical protein
MGCAPSFFQDDLDFQHIIPSTSSIKAWVEEMGMMVKIADRLKIQEAIATWQCYSLNTDGSTELCGSGKAVHSIEVSTLETPEGGRDPTCVKRP